MDPSSLIPVTGPIIDAGTFNWATKRWMTPRASEALRANSMTVYNNTCSWTGANFYFGTGDCTTHFDEGRIPSSTSPNAPPGATDDNLINSFQLGYCGNAATGTIDVKIGFFDNLGGGCLQALGGTPYATPLSSIAQGYFDLGAAAGNPLPGNGCFAVTIALGNTAFCLQSDGNGAFENLGDLDLFNWSWDNDTPPVGANAGAGPLLAGDPSIGAQGACTYNIPCGSDPSPFFAAMAACGTGLDTEDHWWVNIDGDSWGDTINSGAVCQNSVGSGTNCYWFLGYPANVFASFWMKMGSAGECAGCTGNPTPYCTAGTTTSGCNATVSMQGVPSPRNLAPCMITVNNVEGAKNGLIFYGLQQVAVPWGTGTSFLCVKAPTQRILSQPTGGTAGQCDGMLQNDINGYFATHPVALGQPIFAGEVLNFQGWFRDPPAPKTTNLSNGLQITICP
jgi:hypothetical protein